MYSIHKFLQCEVLLQNLFLEEIMFQEEHRKSDLENFLFQRSSS